MQPEEDLNLDDTGSVPQSEFDEWFCTTHKNTKASWDVVEDDDSDELDYQMEYDED